VRETQSETQREAVRGDTVGCGAHAVLTRTRAWAQQQQLALAQGLNPAVAQQLWLQQQQQHQQLMTQAQFQAQQLLLQPNQTYDAGMPSPQPPQPPQ
jgi:hypothetical protein